MLNDDNPEPDVPTNSDRGGSFSTKYEWGMHLFHLFTEIVQEHEDLFLGIACANRMLALSGEAIKTEIDEVSASWKGKDLTEMWNIIGLLPHDPHVVLMRGGQEHAFSAVSKQVALSSLITAHAFFEATLIKLLALPMIFDKEKWVERISNKSIKYSDLKERGLIACETELMITDLAAIKKAGVPKLLALLLNYCEGNVTTKSEFTGYILDCERIANIDNLRHRFAHRLEKPEYHLPQANSDIKYLTYTALHLTMCIADAYGIKFHDGSKNSDSSGAK